MSITLDALAEVSVVYLDASRVRIAVQGEDRASWLNGMTTCDLAPLKETTSPRAAYGCVLNVKGKVLGDVIVVGRDGTLGAFIPTQSAETILALWNKYIIMEDVELAREESRRLVFLQGKRAASVATDAGLISRGAALDEYGASGLVLDVERNEVEELIKRLVSEGAVMIEEGDVHRLRVEAGRATFGVDVDDANYVQEAGLTGRAVSFNKGCYVGQEVVCMLQMRGKVNKKLVKLTLPDAGRAAVGAEVKSGADVVGKLTSLVPRPDGSAVALAMLKASVAEPGSVLEIAGRSAEVLSEAS